MHLDEHEDAKELAADIRLASGKFEVGEDKQRAGGCQRSLDAVVKERMGETCWDTRCKDRDRYGNLVKLAKYDVHLDTGRQARKSVEYPTGGIRELLASEEKSQWPVGRTPNKDRRNAEGENACHGEMDDASQGGPQLTVGVAGDCARLQPHHPVFCCFRNRRASGVHAALH